MDAASRVFSLDELLELILLALPTANTHQELNTIRTILLAQTTSRTWRALLQRSSPLRRRLYLSTATDGDDAQVWQQPHRVPPGRPNPWIPFLLLGQRSWGSAYPFTGIYDAFDNPPPPARPRIWTFTLEVSAAQHARFLTTAAAAGVDDNGGARWREMLAATPPFTEFWCSRCVYELGSGRAPFVTHLDYDPRRPKTRQRFSASCAQGVTLGVLVDAVREVFGEFPDAQFVMVESVRMADGDR